MEVCNVLNKNLIMARLGWIPWRACEARKVLRLDLKPGGYLFDKDDISAEVAYEHYVAMPEFVNVVFSQFKFVPQSN
jgi:hypothetical protein